MQNLKFLDPAKAMANLQKMPADAKVIEMFHILANLTFAYSFKARAVAFLVWRRKMEQDLGNRLGSNFYILMLAIFTLEQLQQCCNVAM